MRQKFSLFLISILCFSSMINAQKITGELKKWEKVTLSVDLPASNLNESADTFKNHRMDVVFTDPNGSKIRVPGYFAADGNAANSSSKSGKTFKAILRPYMTGPWKYEILYYTGTDVALKNVNQLPSPAQKLTGNVGDIQNNNVTAPDLRAKGRLTYRTAGDVNSRRYLQFSETGEFFLKIGPDSPENMLNYDEFDFDAKLNKCGLCPTHKFTPHKNDYKTGDPTFKNGKGKNIIGALNYIKKQDMNSFSMSLYGGDDKNVFPWVNLNNKFVFDVSKLDQWEVVFDHAESLGLVMHLKLAENENWDKLNANEIRAQYREMVARFGHHLAIEWNISEEYRGAAQSAMARINFLEAIDAYQNPRVIHTYPGEHSKYDEWLKLGAKLTGASIQSASNPNDAYDGRSGILTWINKSKNNNTPWVVSSDEQNPGSTGIFNSKSINDKTVKKSARTHYLWKNLIAGGQGVMWYGGGEGDFKTENFDRFSTLFEWSRHAYKFFKENKVPYWEMQNNDNLADGKNNHVLAGAGKTYVIYLEKGGNTQLNLNGITGKFNVKWFDPRNGGNLKDGSVTTISGGAKRGIGNPPNNANDDWVALVTNTDNSATITNPPVVTNPTPEPNVPVTDDCKEKIFEENEGVIAIEAEDFFEQTKISKREWFIFDGSTKNTPKPDPDGDHSEGASNGKYIELLPDTRVVHADPLENGVSFTNTPGEAAIISYKVNFKSAGKYFVWVRAYSTGSEDNGIHVGLDGNWPASGARMQWCGGKNKWTWESKQRTAANHCGEPEKIFLNVPSAGLHTVSFSMREDGFEVDKMILSKTYKKPTDAGTFALVNNCNDTTPTTPTTPTNGSCNKVTLQAIDDFSNLNISGFSPAYKDNARKAIAINAAQHKDKFAAAETSFTGETGTYNVKLNTLAELDGESTYRLNINGKLIGTYKNPETTTDYAPAGKTFNNISVKKGDKIRVEFSSHTNGKIPENGGTAFSRGRWTGIEFICTESTPPTAPTTGVKSITLSPIYDAFLQNGVNNNTNELKIEKGKRVAYLKFDLSAVTGTINAANLELNVSGDAGNGIIKVYQGKDTNGWTETNLDNTNTPTKGSELGSLDKNYPLNSKNSIALSDLNKSNFVTLIIEMESGNDVSFASKESGNNGPKLTITYTESTLSINTPDVDNEVRASIFPNPTTDYISINSANSSKLKSIKVFNLNGILLQGISNTQINNETNIDLSNYSNGIYLISLQDAKNNIKIIKVIKE
ncbi:CBM96 family carbohydrate-binding protein [Aquimarina agarilytica]|uniref:CBM96 family carbohydrate-binding protein n=1 Tax=Aquimarina agarilytica TaxID=1087449 RepID=UPI00058BFAAE|nr:T9SS type A sorting domain-containing protein [Aquimarina agarilytica]